MRANQVLQRGERNEKPSAVAVLDDCRDMPVVIQKRIRITHIKVFRFSGPVIDKKIVGSLHIVTLKENKTAGNIAEALPINPINHVDTPAGIELQQSGRYRLNIFQFAKLVSALDGDR